MESISDEDVEGTLREALSDQDIEDDFEDIDGVAIGRKAAEQFAKRKLTASATVTATASGALEKNISRQNVLPNGDKWVHSDTVGIIEDRIDHENKNSAITRGHDHFFRFISAWAHKRSPSCTDAGRLHRDAHGRSSLEIL